MRRDQFRWRKKSLKISANLPSAHPSPLLTSTPRRLRNRDSGTVSDRLVKATAATARRRDCQTTTEAAPRLD